MGAQEASAATLAGDGWQVVDVGKALAVDVYTLKTTKSEDFSVTWPTARKLGNKTLPLRRISYEWNTEKHLADDKANIVAHNVLALKKCKSLPFAEIEIDIKSISAIYSERGLTRQPPHRDWSRKAISDAINALIKRRRIEADRSKAIHGGK